MTHLQRILGTLRHWFSEDPIHTIGGVHQHPPGRHVPVGPDTFPMTPQMRAAYERAEAWRRKVRGRGPCQCTCGSCGCGLHQTT